MLVTDSIVKVPTEPPAIVAEDPSGLLFHARDNYQDVVADTPETRRKGWRRSVLFGLTFNPSSIDIQDLFSAIKSLPEVPEHIA